MASPLFVPVSGPSESMTHIHKHIHICLLKLLMNEINGPEVKSLLMKTIPKDTHHLHLLFSPKATTWKSTDSSQLCKATVKGVPCVSDVCQLN